MGEGLRAALSSRRATAALAALWVLAVAVVTVPSAITGVGSWLDGSWQVALDLSHRLGLPMGSRLLFTYGPYGYLSVTTPFFIRQWLEAVAAGVVIHVALIALVCLLLVRHRAGPVLWLAVTAALVIGLPGFTAPDTDGQLIAILLAYMAVDTESRRGALAAAALCGAILALLLLMKATALPLAAGVLVLGIAGLVSRRRGAAAAAMAASLLVVGAVLWFAAGLHLADIGHYLHAALDLGSGYSGAMYFMGVTPGIILGSAVITVLGVLGLVLLARRRHRDALWLLLSAVVLFPLFKDSFVRDGPARDGIFFGAVAIVASLSAVAIAPRVRSWWSARQVVPAALVAACFLLGVCWRATDLSAVAGVGDRLSTYGTAIRAVVSSSVSHSLQASVLENAQGYYGGTISALPAFPAGSTVDVWPWDTGLIYEDGKLRWDPRPVLQSYLAYTPWLDQQDAAFLDGSSAPDYIVYSDLTIDDRYAPFDEPAAFRALLANYRVIKTEGPSVAILQRVAAPAVPVESAAGSRCAPLGQAVAIPQATGVQTFAHLSLARSALGSILDLAAKAPEARVTLTTAAGSTNYRLVDAVAVDGLYVSGLIASTPDIAVAMLGSGGTPITSLAVSGQAIGWSSRYCVTFTTTPIAPVPAP